MIMQLIRLPHNRAPLPASTIRPIIPQVTPSALAPSRRRAPCATLSRPRPRLIINLLFQSLYQEHSCDAHCLIYYFSQQSQPCSCSFSSRPAAQMQTAAAHHPAISSRAWLVVRKPAKSLPSKVRTSIPASRPPSRRDRKSTRLNSSHQLISYAVFC